MRKMLVAMAKDLRVLIIKLADRLHNMRTHRRACRRGSRSAPPRRRSTSTPPLAHRLGMQDLKQQLEDLAFAALHPKRYAEIDHMVATRTPERELYLDAGARGRARPAQGAAHRRRRHRPAEAPVEHLREDGRQGHASSTTSSTSSASGSSSTRSRTATPRSARSTPRGSRCRGGSRTTSPCPSSTSTSRCTRRWSGPQGKPLEVQIRTVGDAPAGRVRRRRPLELQGQPRLVGRPRLAQPHRRLAAGDRPTPTQFMANLKVDLDQDEVFVFTPKGRVITLPVGRHAGRLRLLDPHRGRPHLHRRPGQRPAGAARHQARVGRHGRDLHLEGRGRRAVAGLAEVRRHPPGRQQDPPVVLP